MGLLDFLQGASNAAASNVSAPVDGMAWALRKLGLPIPEAPLGGSDWMAAKGLTVEPKNRLAGLLGESAGAVAPMLLAAKAPQVARGLLQMGENYAAPATLNKQAGAVYFRNTNGGSPTNDVPWAMFSQNADSVSHYGKNKWAFDDSALPKTDVLEAWTKDGQRQIAKALLQDRRLLKEYGVHPKILAKESAPSNIVDSAGLWDNPDIVQSLWENLLEPRGYKAVLTPDGAVVFENELIKRLK